MPEKEFMAKYCDGVQAEYKLPTPDELEWLEQQDEEDEVEEELDVSGEGSGDEWDMGVVLYIFWLTVVIDF
jgi:hypothetical protein